MIDLITMDEYKDANGITSHTDDVKLEQLVSSVSTLIKTYCGRAFVDYVDVDKVEYVSVSNDEYFIQLDEFPVISITSVEERSGYSEDYAALTEASNQFWLDPNTHSVYKTDGGTGYTNFAKGPGSVKITYKAGFADIPEDLKLVAMDLVTYYYKNEYRGYQMLGGASSRTPTTTSQYKNVSFPDHIKRVLDLYKNI